MRRLPRNGSRQGLPFHRDGRNGHPAPSPHADTAAVSPPHHLPIAPSGGRADEPRSPAAALLGRPCWSALMTIGVVALDDGSRAAGHGGRDARGTAVRKPGKRSGARVPGGRPHRRNQRVAGTDRSRAPDRQGPDSALQGDDEDGRRDRPGALRRLSRGELDSGGRWTAARHRDVDSRQRSGARVVAVLRSRADQPAWLAAGAERGDRGAGSAPAFARDG